MRRQNTIYFTSWALKSSSNSSRGSTLIVLSWKFRGHVMQNDLRPRDAELSEHWRKYKESTSTTRTNNSLIGPRTSSVRNSKKTTPSHSSSLLHTEPATFHNWEKLLSSLRRNFPSITPWAHSTLPSPATVFVQISQAFPFYLQSIVYPSHILTFVQPKTIAEVVFNPKSVQPGSAWNITIIHQYTHPLAINHQSSPAQPLPRKKTPQGATTFFF